jgi:hypothetical protein
MTSREELLPRPFCGGQPIWRGHFLECGDCSAQGPIDRETATGWNKRIPPQAMPWQPIETAPRDKSILLSEEGIVGEGYYDGESGYWFWANTHPLNFEPCQEVFPTHWQPLPDPPAQ